MDNTIKELELRIKVLELEVEKLKLENEISGKRQNPFTHPYPQWNEYPGVIYCGTATQDPNLKIEAWN